MFCIESRFTSCATHGALITADGRRGESHSACVLLDCNCLQCVETSGAGDEQASRGGVSNVTRLCAGPPPLTRREVCLSALTRCFPRRLRRLKGNRPRLLRLAGQRALCAEQRGHAGNCVRAQVVLLEEAVLMSFLAAPLRADGKFFCFFCTRF